MNFRIVRPLSAFQRVFSAALLLALGALTSAPAMAATFVVNIGGNTNSLSDDLGDANPGNGVCADTNGKCSLRAAIQEANNLAGAPHTINFALPVVHVINGGLPMVTAPVIISGPAMVDGTGNGFKHGCFTFSDATTALFPEGATGSVVTLLSIVNCSGDAISANGHGYTFTGNFIGVDPTGLIAMPNTGAGITMSSSHVYGNVNTSALDALFQTFPQLPVQGSDVQTFVQNLKTKLATLLPDTITGNVISSNQGDGITLSSENLGAVFVSGNMIGTDISGNVAMGNGGSGITLLGNTFGNVIGPNNTISANGAHGINLGGTVYLPNFVMGNRIGIATTVTGQHIGNAMSGIYAATKPDTTPTNFNPSMLAAFIGPGNFISDNKGAPNGTDPDVLTTNGAGIYITGIGTGVKVIGNTIGMAEIPLGTPLQTNAYGNAGDGIIITSTGNTVSGGNVIAGNKRHGIVISTSANTSTHIIGNTIGLYPAFAGDLTLGNGFDGIHNDGASSTYIGGPNASDFNVIGGNGRNGVKIMGGGSANGWSILLQRNQIFSNARGNPAAMPNPLPPGVGVGIDLDHTANASDGPHPEFPTSYSNLDQSPAVICTGAPAEPMQCQGFTAPASSNGMTTFDWTIATHGPATFRLEFFQINSANDNTATSMSFLGEQTVTTDLTGFVTGCPNGRCTASVPVNTAGSYVVMNVTDVTPLTDQPGMLGDWKNNLKCFVGDLGIILSACTANNTSELSDVVQMPLSSNANLSNLTISNGMLTPAFASGTLNYTDAVANAVASVTVTPTVADPTATVKVNGNTVASGSASAAIALAVGINNINVAVTAQNGTTVQTYTIAVSRAGALSNNASLASLTISSGMLTPVFAMNTLSYTDAVANAVASVTVTPTTADANATIKVNGTTVASGAASGAIALAVGMNNISVAVTAQDGTTLQTYTIAVNRAGALSNNAGLSNLAISSGTLTPAFAMATLNYTDAVANAVNSVTVTPTTADANATVKVNGNTVASGSASAAVNLVVGANNIAVLVTAQDGTTTQTYTITVNRAGVLSNNANLSSLTISSGTLTPAFASNTLNYTDNVANAVNSATVTPTTADANATIKVNGNTVASGAASAAIALAVGMNNVSVAVTAQDGTTVQTYTIVVNRAGALSNNANLSALTISSGTLTPAFASNTLGYTDSVANAVASVTVTPTSADANATIKVNGNTVASGAASGALALAVGANNVNVVVTAQDGTTVQTYTIAVNRAGALSNNANLSALTISSGVLTPVFAANTLNYTDGVANAVASLTVTPMAADANATITVNGNAVLSGSTSASIALAVGNNNVSVVVTAQDGTTIQTYTIVVNRAGALSNNANLSAMAISSGTLTPAFAANTLGYSDNVANAVTSLTVTPTAADANATIKVNGNTVASGAASGAIALAIGANNVSVVVTAQDGTTTQSYTITVNRAGALSNNANLAALTISSGTLTPAFAANTLAYTDAVANGIASLSVTPTTADANATVTVNGSMVASGTASGAVALAVGMNTITVVVTAQDGTTTQSYTIVVTRAAAVVTNFSGTTFTNTGTLSANITGGGASCSFGSASLVGAPVAPPSGVTFPDGLFQFTLTNCVGSVTVHATFPTAFAAGEQYYKYGPTPGSPSAHWYMLGATNSLTLAGNVATFTIADGGLGDDDLAVNGTIVDQGGPGVITVVTGGNGIAATPTLSQWAQLLMMGLLALVGLIAAGQRAQRNRAR